VVVLRLIEEVGIVISLVTTEFNLTKEFTLNEKPKRPVNRSPGNSAIYFPDHLMQIICRKMLLRAEGSLDDHVTLLSPSQLFAGKEFI
jgi:hypothetical protein